MKDKKNKNKQAKANKGKGGKGQNRKNTEEFLAKNKHKEGVVELDSGLQYLVVDEDGIEDKTLKPDMGATVTIHQRISLIDGSMIDDTYQKNKTEEFTMQEAIEGLQEGLQLMPKGSRYKFFIPPDLAWGKRGAGKIIGPNATLIIDIRLVDFF